MLSLPVVLPASALTPVAVFSAPVLLSTSAATPLAVFRLPVVLPASALSPVGRVGFASGVGEERQGTIGRIG